MDCFYCPEPFSQEDRELLLQMLGQYDAQLMLKSWAELGQVSIPGGTRVDPDKARAAEILKRKAFCPREKAFVSAVDLACYAFKEKPRESPSQAKPL
jgi:hypothetical protein